MKRKKYILNYACLSENTEVTLPQSIKMVIFNKVKELRTSGERLWDCLLYHMVQPFGEEGCGKCDYTYATSHTTASGFGAIEKHQGTAQNRKVLSEMWEARTG